MFRSKWLYPMIGVLLALSMLFSVYSARTASAANATEQYPDQKYGVRFLALVDFRSMPVRGLTFAQGGDTLLSQQFIIQANSAFERILPRLIRAQRAGLIRSFSPDLRIGLVKVTYPFSQEKQLLEEFGKDNLLQDPKPILNRVVPILEEHRVQGGSTYNPQFEVSVWGCFWRAGGLLPGQSVIVLLKDKSGNLVGIDSGVVAQDSDYVSGCLWQDELRTGYKVTFKIYQNGALRNTFTRTIPPVKFTAVDKANGTVTFSTPAWMDSYALTWWREVPNYSHTWLSDSKTGTISATSTTVTIGSKPFKGGDGFSVTIYSGRFKFLHSFSVPYIACGQDFDPIYGTHSWCYYRGFANKKVMLVRSHNGTKTAYQKNTSWWGSAWFNVEVKNGDRFWATKVPANTIVPLTATLDYTNDSISGNAPETKKFEVNLWWWEGWYWIGSWWVHSDSTGHWQINQAGLSMLPYQVGIRYIYPGTGNRLEKYFYFLP